MGTARLAAAFCLVGSALALAEGTPAEPRATWDAQVAQLAAALPAGGRDKGLADLLPDAVQIASLDGSNGGGVVGLLITSADRPVLGQVAYAGLPATLASDLGEQLAERGAPQAVLDLMIPHDPARADAIAQRWVGEALQADGEAPVALILLGAQGEAPGAAADQLVFVLVRGAVQDDGSARIDRILFGQPARSR